MAPGSFKEVVIIITIIIDLKILPVIHTAQGMPIYHKEDIKNKLDDKLWSRVASSQQIEKDNLHHGLTV